MQGRNRQYRQSLYQTLLRVYLRPKDESHHTLIRPALELLNARGADFDAAEVYMLLWLLSLSLSPPPHIANMPENAYTSLLHIDTLGLRLYVSTNYSGFRK